MLILSNLKAFADNIFSVAPILQFLVDKEENIVRKGENAGYHHCSKRRKCWLPAFSPPTFFSKGCFHMANDIKGVEVLYYGLMQGLMTKF